MRQCCAALARPTVSDHDRSAFRGHLVRESENAAAADALQNASRGSNPTGMRVEAMKAAGSFEVRANARAHALGAVRGLQSALDIPLFLLLYLCTYLLS